jgi:hypothetical protein
VTRGSAGGGITGLEALQKDEGGECDRRIELGAISGECDQYGKLSLEMSR